MEHVKMQTKTIALSSSVEFEERMNTLQSIGWIKVVVNCGECANSDGHSVWWMAILERRVDYVGARIERLMQLIELAQHGVEVSKNDDEVKIWQQKDEEYEAEIKLLQEEK